MGRPTNLLFAAALFCALTSVAQTQPSVPKTTPWWDHAVIYEIYPRSFQDSNNDGVGDLNGITQRLDYLQHLGVDAIWLTPIYPSPQIDFGYDISDYTAIDPQYGTMADFDHLVAEAKRRHIRILMDLVLNHTSDQHPWFIESASSRTNPKRDWYIWRDGKPGKDGKLLPPNNWVNRIEQSAWRYFPQTGQFNYHYYAPEQPDLNWRNPQVEQAMFKAARFWLDRGVDGFRLDAINTLFERDDLRDEPATPGTNEYGEPSLSMVYQRNMPEVHDILRDLRRLTDSYPGDRLLLGEIYTQSTPEMATWYGSPKGPELQLPMDTNVGFLNKFDAAAFRKLIGEAESLHGHTPLFVFDNHDRPRSWDRYGDGVHNIAIQKVLATILLATRSTALVYQGEELGMKTTMPTRKEDVRDPRGLAGWPAEKGRDGERTPMQWNPTPTAGFTSARPWLPIPTDSKSFNVETEKAAPDSVLTWYSSLLQLRRDQPALAHGDITLLNRDAQKALVWIRHSTQQSNAVIVANNMSDKPVTLSLKADLARTNIHGTSLKRLLCSFECTERSSADSLVLPPFTSYIGLVSAHN